MFDQYGRDGERAKEMGRYTKRERERERDVKAENACEHYQKCLRVNSKAKVRMEI